MTDIHGPGGELLFRHAELACRATGVVQLAPAFDSRLVELRLKYGRPMVVTSCCRSASHNERVGGHPHSLHVFDRPFHATGGTAAIDIKAASAEEAMALIETAIPLGWSVGLPKHGFVHLDRRVDFGMPRGAFGY